MNSNISISIIIILDDHTTIAENIAAIASQKNLPKRFETIVVNPHPDVAENKKQIATINPVHALRVGLRVLEVDKIGRGAAKNIALEKCSGDLIIFISDDFIPGKAWLNAHLSLHSERPETTVVGIGAGFFNDNQRRDPFVAWLEDSGVQFGISFTSADPLPPTFFYSGNASINRSFLDEAGPFEAEFPFHSSDDWEMGLRLSANGMEAVYLPEAVAWHHHRVGIPDRILSTWECGFSNALHDRCNEGFSRPNYCTRSSSYHHWRSLLSKARWFFTRDSSAREDYWINMLAHAYLKGYRIGARQPI